MSARLAWSLPTVALAGFACLSFSTGMAGSARLRAQEAAERASPPTEAAGAPLRELAQRPADIASPRAEGRVDRQDLLDLEAAVNQAELIVAARLADVAETRIVHGGRDEQVTQQFRLEPIRTLKGIFAHDALLMTGDDLGITRFSDAPDGLARGQTLLVLLGRQNGRLFMCNPAATLAQSIPRLTGPDDPLLDVVSVLIEATQARDRVKRVEILRDGLARSEGRSAVPLLYALGRRGPILAQVAGTLEHIVPSLSHPSAAVREVAARTTEALLAGDYLGQTPLRQQAVRALLESAGKAGPGIDLRLAIVDALGAAGPAALEVAGLADAIALQPAAPSLAEQAARMRARGKIGGDSAFDQLAEIYAALPVDAPVALENAAGSALVQIDRGARASVAIENRLIRKYDAGLDISEQLERLADLPAPVATPALVRAFARPLDFHERRAFARAAAQFNQPELVPALGALLDNRQPDVRSIATDALLKIDSSEAASFLSQSLDQEPDLARKLRVLAMLGKHGSTNGYEFAVEHLSEAQNSNAAIDAVVASRSPRAADDLLTITRTSHDPLWNAAAFRALARLRQPEIVPTLEKAASDLTDPLAPAALESLADLGNASVAPRVLEALQSRNETVLLAGVKSARLLMADPIPNPAMPRDRLRAALAERLADPLTPLAVRLAVVAALTPDHGAESRDALRSAMRESGLEGTRLLPLVEAEIVRRQIPLDPQPTN